VRRGPKREDPELLSIYLLEEEARFTQGGLGNLRLYLGTRSGEDETRVRYVRSDEQGEGGRGVLDKSKCLRLPITRQRCGAPTWRGHAHIERGGGKESFFNSIESARTGFHLTPMI